MSHKASPTKYANQSTSGVKAPANKGSSPQLNRPVPQLNKGFSEGKKKVRSEK